MHLGGPQGHVILGSTSTALAFRKLDTGSSSPSGLFRISENGGTGSNGRSDRTDVSAGLAEGFESYVVSQEVESRGKPKSDKPKGTGSAYQQDKASGKKISCVRLRQSGSGTLEKG
jgi:hypothetical protein